MLHFPLNSASRKFCLYITIECSGKQRFRCVASEYKRINSKYADRTITVEGKRRIYFSFPLSPDAMVLTVCNYENPSDKNFKVTLEEGPIRDYAVWLDDDTRDFLKLADHFSEVCGYERAAPMGRMFATDDDHFKIKYFPIIKDYMSGRTLNTPARIGHQTGTIEVAKAKFDPYTIPMRECILCHEFSHKFKNPKMGLPIDNEIGADINGLYIYLGRGFSKVDAIYVYANVFLKAQTPGNIQRMRKIMDYIQRFENEEFAKRA